MHHSHSQGDRANVDHPTSRSAVHPVHDVVEDPVAIDCSSCDVRGLACGDCVVTVLLGTPPAWLDDEEQRAIGVLADSGLVPPLRLVTSGEVSSGEELQTGVARVSTSARRVAFPERETG